jgi:DNA-binding NarL/FixJ family response regulator
MASGEAFGLLLTDDMIFSSRITGTARSLELKVSAVKSVEDLISQARNNPPTCVIIDLSHTGLQVRELIRELKEACSSMPRMVAYGSHVDAATLRAAREAGCDVVLPRSKFVEGLADQLPAWLAPPTT